MSWWSLVVHLIDGGFWVFLGFFFPNALAFSITCCFTKSLRILSWATNWDSWCCTDGISLPRYPFFFCSFSLNYCKLAGGGLMQFHISSWKILFFVPPSTPPDSYILGVGDYGYEKTKERKIQFNPTPTTKKNALKFWTFSKFFSLCFRRRRFRIKFNEGLKFHSLPQF